MNKQKLLIIVDPLPNGFSVQYNFVVSLVKYFLASYSVTIYSNFIAGNKSNALKQMGVNVLNKRSSLFPELIKKVLFVKLNESTLWGANWFLDLLTFKLNKSNRVERFSGYNVTLNISSTIVCESDVLWLQGPPFIDVVESMALTNYLAKAFLRLFRHVFSNASIYIVRTLAKNSTSVVANSKYIYNIYKSLNLNVSAVVYNSPSAFENFAPSNETYVDKYVLAYIGKETEIETLYNLAKENIKIIGFGSKLPPGMNVLKLKEKILYLGRVTESKLIRLYGGALFVAFPFTNEPFGCVPIESMLCGTPVLTYNKEGPSETVVNGETGWLVNTSEEFLSLAKTIWENEETGISKEMCIKRGREFTFESVIPKLDALFFRSIENGIHGNS
ncbi:MAG: glycosyltransferase [Thermoplasmataceae archaeon]